MIRIVQLMMQEAVFNWQNLFYRIFHHKTKYIIQGAKSLEITKYFNFRTFQFQYINVPEISKLCRTFKTSMDKIPLVNFFEKSQHIIVKGV